MTYCTLIFAFVIFSGCGQANSSSSGGGCGGNSSNSANATSLVIDSLTGDITQNEVDTFVTVVSKTTIPTAEWDATVTHNQLADGNGGGTLEAINLLADTISSTKALGTEHTELLNLAMKWTEAWLTHRNDPPLGEWSYLS
ncbi:MAG: hypothetical protein P4K83_02725 [Terracidiphilus sp.]|nr:hypothetical protein [Terracidiphilus sp.]